MKRYVVNLEPHKTAKPLNYTHYSDEIREELLKSPNVKSLPIIEPNSISFVAKCEANKFPQLLSGLIRRLYKIKDLKDARHSVVYLSTPEYKPLFDSSKTYVLDEMEKKSYEIRIYIDKTHFYKEKIDAYDEHEAFTKFYKMIERKV